MESTADEKGKPAAEMTLKRPGERPYKGNWRLEMRSETSHNTHSAWRRVGGATAVFGGLIWATFHLWLIQSGRLDSPMSIGNSLSILIVPLLAFMLASYALSCPSGSGRGGLLLVIGGMGLMVLGITGVSLLQIGAAWLVGILGELVTSIGLGWFAFANLGDKRLPAFNGLPLVMLLLYVPSWMVDPGNLPGLFPAHFTEWLAAVYGLNWVVLGGLLLLPGTAKAIREG